MSIELGCLTNYFHVGRGDPREDVATTVTERRHHDGQRSVTVQRTRSGRLRSFGGRVNGTRSTWRRGWSRVNRATGGGEGVGERLYR